MGEARTARRSEGGSVANQTAILAAAAGALLLAAAPALAADQEGSAAKVKCEGVNSCKGQSDCHTANNECAGKNCCKGKGFKMMTPEECKAAKEKLEKEGLNDAPFLGVGVGLRTPHSGEILGPRGARRAPRGLPRGDLREPHGARRAAAAHRRGAARPRCRWCCTASR